jgi:excisionase family DNA binding protein
MTSERNKIPSVVGAAPRFFTISDIAEFLDVSPRSVRRWIKSGELPVHRFGAAVRIAERDLLAFVAVHREG